MKHLRAQAVEHREADIVAVFGRIVVDPERALAEGHVDDLDDLVGHAAGLGVVGDDRGERLQHLFAEALVGPASYSATRASSAGRPECAKWFVPLVNAPGTTIVVSM